MALGFRLDLRKSQQLVMTPQLQQAIKLLQMSNLELREFVEHELESNPLISVEDSPENVPSSQPDAQPDSAETPLDARLTPEGDHSLTAETFDTGTENLYDRDPNEAGGDETGSSEGGAMPGIGTGVGAGGNRSFDTPGFDMDHQPDHPESLRAHLLAQLALRRAEPRVLLLARLLVEELDEHGYLRADLAELAARSAVAPGAGLAQEFLDRHAQGGGHGDEHVGTGKVPALFPVADVGLVLADLAGQLALGQTSGFPEGTES